MSNPSKQQIAAAILELSKKQSTRKLSEAVAQYLIHERRSNELDSIMREVQKLRHEQQDILEVDLVSAFPLQNKVKNELTKLLKGNDKYVTNEIIDETVLGGVRMETSEVQLDLTVRNRLNQLKQGVNA